MDQVVIRTYVTTDLPNWFTCQLCWVTYRPVDHEHPCCIERMENAHWLARYILGAVFSITEGKS